MISGSKQNIHTMCTRSQKHFNDFLLATPKDEIPGRLGQISVKNLKY